VRLDQAPAESELVPTTIRGRLSPTLPVSGRNKPALTPLALSRFFHDVYVLVHLLTSSSLDTPKRTSSCAYLPPHAHTPGGFSQRSSQTSDQARTPNGLFKFFVLFLAVVSPWQMYAIYNYYQVGKRVVVGEKKLAENPICTTSTEREPLNGKRYMVHSRDEAS